MTAKINGKAELRQLKICGKLGYDTKSKRINLITITNYSGLNPEIQTSKDKTLGFDGGYMPVSKTFIIGMNLNLF